MSPVYNTGKVLIGSNYVRHTPPVIEGHALMLQSALLEPRTAQPLTFVWRVLGSIARWL